MADLQYSSPAPAKLPANIDATAAETIPPPPDVDTAGEAKFEYIQTAPDNESIKVDGLILEAGLTLVKVAAMGPYFWMFARQILTDHPYLLVNKDGEIVKVMSKAKNGVWTFIGDPSSPNWKEMAGKITLPVKRLRNRAVAMGKAAKAFVGGVGFISRRPWIAVMIALIIIVIAAVAIYGSTKLPPAGTNFDFISDSDAFFTPMGNKK